MAPVKKSKPTSWFSRLISFAGWAFAVLTVVINLADVTTDVIVAVQFHQGGHTVWFALVVTFLLVAHCVYTGVFAEVLPRQSDEWRRLLNPNGSVPRPLRWLLGFIFAQFVPLLNLIVVTMGERREKRRDERNRLASERQINYESLRHEGGDVENRLIDDQRTVARDVDDAPITIDGFTFLPKATLQELEDIENSRELQERIAAAVEEHLQKFGLFYVESAVEAAPQAIIQLLAITFLGEASPVQLVSLCCSLFSITSKAFIISQAYDARVMIFKFALAAHDVFSMFYLFSTIVAVETHKDVSFFGLELSWVGYVWMWKMVVVAGLAFCTATGFVCLKMYDSRHWIDEVLHLLRQYVFGLFVAGPLSLVYEAAKLSYANLGVTLVEPAQRDVWPACTLLFNFVSTDDSKGSRLRHMVRAVHRTPSVNSAEQDLFTAVNDDAKQFSLWNFPLLTRAPPKLRFETPLDRRETFLLSWMIFCLVVVLLGQLLSLAYPFVNAAFQFKTHNILQATCFYATCVALLIALITTPRTLKFTLFNVGIKPYLYCINLDMVQKLISEYHLPPHISALQVYITAVPMEVAGVVGAYLNASDVDLGCLTIAQTTALKRQIKAIGADGFAIVDFTSAVNQVSLEDDMESDSGTTLADPLMPSALS